MHRTTPAFWSHFEQLPETAQRAAERSFEHLRENPQHPSLHFKKVGRFWSARIGLKHRALSVKDGNDYTWVWIGGHADYDRIVGLK